MDYACGNCGADVADDDCCPCYAGIDTSVPEFLRDLEFAEIDLDALLAQIGG